MSQQLFNIALQAIIDTAKQAYIEGYSEADSLYNHEGYPIDCEAREESWQNSSVKAACDRMIENLRSK